MLRAVSSEHTLTLLEKFWGNGHVYTRKVLNVMLKIFEQFWKALCGTVMEDVTKMWFVGNVQIVSLDGRNKLASMQTVAAMGKMSKWLSTSLRMFLVCRTDKKAARFKKKIVIYACSCSISAVHVLLSIRSFNTLHIVLMLIKTFVLQYRTSFCNAELHDITGDSRYPASLLGPADASASATFTSQGSWCDSFGL